MGHAGKHFGAFLLGDAAGGGNDQAGVLFFAFPQGAEQTVSLLFSLITDTAGVDDDGIRRMHCIRYVMCRGKKLTHDFRIPVIHLAAEGFYIKQFFVVHPFYLV